MTTRTNSEEIKTVYFQWLAEQIENKTYNQTYFVFLKYLHNHTFVPIIPNDYNRAVDGTYLRDCFENVTNYSNLLCLQGPCTMLEMLIGLAKRIDFMVSNDRMDQTAKWFWVFVKNLKLNLFWSGDSNISKKQDSNDEILRIFIERKYDPNGVGGLFPLDNPKKDQRNLEIWYQMMAYIEELGL